MKRTETWQSALYQGLAETGTVAIGTHAAALTAALNGTSRFDKSTEASSLLPLW